MKLRITQKGLRFRLTQTEVRTLADTGRLEETMPLAPQSLVVRIEGADAAAAHHSGPVLAVQVPNDAMRSWAGSDQEALRAQHGAVEISIEKDYACLHHPADNEDTFTNPATAN